MNYQYLIYFKTVAELQHYTRAAEALFITQPALSKAIRNLEHELGVSLFQKEGRNVILTSYGTLFYEYVKRAVEEINNGLFALRRMDAINHNTIFASVLFSMYTNYLSDRMFTFQKKHPNCRFSIEYKYTSGILHDILTGNSHLGICGNFFTKGEWLHLDKHTLFSEPVALLVNTNHPFAKKDVVAPIELKNEKFIVYTKSGLGTNMVLNDLCKPFGFLPNIVAEAYDDYGVIGMVSLGTGIAVVPQNSFISANYVKIVPFDTPEPVCRDINLVWNRCNPLPPLAQEFFDFLTSNADVL